MIMFDIIAYIVPLRTHLLLKSNICSLNLQNRKQLPNPYQLYSSSLFSSFAALPYFHHSMYQLAKKPIFLEFVFGFVLIFVMWWCLGCKITFLVTIKHLDLLGQIIQLYAFSVKKNNKKTKSG